MKAKPWMAGIAAAATLFASVIAPAGAMAEEATAPSTPRNFHDLRDQRQHRHGEGHGCGRVQDMERKDLFEQPHVQSGESRQLQDR